MCGIDHVESSRVELNLCWENHQSEVPLLSRNLDPILVWASHFWRSRLVLACLGFASTNNFPQFLNPSLDWFLPYDEVEPIPKPKKVTVEHYWLSALGWQIEMNSTLVQKF